MKDSTISKLTRSYLGQCLFLIGILSPDKISFLIFNFWSRLKNSAVSLNKQEVSGKTNFIVTDKTTNVEWYQVSKRSAFISFLSGFKERGVSLILQYGIECADFANTSVIIDCGANTGDFAIAAKVSGFRGSYLAFEPSKLAYEALKKNLAILQNSHCFNKGLWFEETTLKFYVSEFGADSSFEMPVSYTETIKVETITIDSIVSKLAIDNSDQVLLKIEAEGCEPEVLKGAETFLSSFGGKIKIVVDVGFERGIREESTLSDVSKILTRKGFMISGYARGRHVVVFER